MFFWGADVNSDIWLNLFKLGVKTDTDFSPFWIILSSPSSSQPGPSFPGTSQKPTVLSIFLPVGLPSLLTASDRDLGTEEKGSLTCLALNRGQITCHMLGCSWISGAVFLPGPQPLGKTHIDFYYLLFHQCLTFPFPFLEHSRTTFYFIFYLTWCLAFLPAPKVHAKSCPYKLWSTQRRDQMVNYPGCLWTRQGARDNEIHGAAVSRVAHPFSSFCYKEVW